jgi:hypothetical protein
VLTLGLLAAAGTPRQAAHPGVGAVVRATALAAARAIGPVPGLYEWTYLSATSSLAHHPSGWCLTGSTACAHFFGGVGRGTRYALMWQWSGGGGFTNGHGDFDQIDASRTP